MKVKSAVQHYIFGALFIGIASSRLLQEDHSKDVIGKNCVITEPAYGSVFNLTKLRSDVNHKVKNTATNNGDYVEFNVCGNPSVSCAGSNVPACFHENGKTLRFGHLEKNFSEPIHTNGRIYFNFTGDLCKKAENEAYTLMILTVCDYSSHIEQPLVLLPYEDDTCTFVVMWKTSFVCHPLSGPLKSNTCTAKDPKTNHIFNLMPLNDVNHRIPYENGTDFLINVCKPLQYAHTEMCPPGSSVCMAKPDTGTDTKKRFIKIGSTIPDPAFENNLLFMKFSSNEPCSGKDKNITSVIDFICDETQKLGQPTFLGKRECEYRFTWGTALACKKVTPCRIIDPTTDFIYDLNKLSGKKYSVKHENETYSFGICTSPGDPCIENTGACLTSNGQSSSMGIVNSELLLLDGKDAPMLSYESGSVCQSLGTHWKTTIEFICKTDGMTEGPKIVENTNCTVVIQFVTDLVCRNEISCKAFDLENNREYDLSALKSSSSNYLARIDDKLRANEPTGVVYYLNVCKPLVPQYGLSCSGNTAACRGIIKDTKNPEQEHSLGYPHVSLTVVDKENNERRPQLRYLFGDSCPKDSNTKLSSQIEFFCDPKAGKGTPILRSIQHDCHYEFEWPTNIICPAHVGQFNESSCEMFNNQINKSLPLKNIFEKGSLDMDFNGKSYEINLCKDNKKIEIDYAHSTVNLFYDVKAPCGPDEIVNAEIRLTCSNDGSSDKGVSYTQSCGYVYTLKTPEICSQLAIELDKANAVNVTKAVTNEANRSTFSLGGILIISAVGFALLAIVFILRKPERRDRIYSLLGRGNATVHYSRVRSNEEANLLLDHPILSDSDEDLLI